ncbi:MAG: hypothetical protein H7145_22460 [Akkermansiaceae bacterium]|nr:hypothetical protein [Armatimonadota bacterium]
MATETTLEERVAALEAEVAAMKQNKSLRDLPHVVGRTAPDFLDRYFGIYAGNKTAEEVLTKIEAEREREREAARNAPDEEDEE